jgi:hypothetical protein
MGDGEINVDATVGKTTSRGSMAAIGINDTGESWVPRGVPRQDGCGDLRGSSMPKQFRLPVISRTIFIVWSHKIGIQT